MAKTKSLDKHLDERLGIGTDERREFEAEFSVLSFGAALQSARNACGSTQYLLADSAHIKQPMVNRIERGGQAPTLPTIVRLLNALGSVMTVWPSGHVEIEDYASAMQRQLLWHGYAAFRSNQAATVYIANDVNPMDAGQTFLGTNATLPQPSTQSPRLPSVAAA